MKQKIYLVGIITTALLSAGAIFKINHWPGAAILLTSGVLLMLALFLPLALASHYRVNRDPQTRILYTVTYITCLVVFIAMLFKILHWPFAGILLFIAIPFPFVVFLPVWLYATSRINNFNINNTVLILFLLVFQSIFSVFLALNVSKDRIENTIVLNDQISSFNKKADSIPMTARNDVLASGVDLLKRIDECKTLLYGMTGMNEKGLNAIHTRYLDSRSIGSVLLVNDNSGSYASRLEASLKVFIGKLRELPEFSDDKHLEIIFGLSPADGNLTWSEMMFSGTYFTWNLVDLEGLENAVKIILSSLP